MPTQTRFFFRVILPALLVSSLVKGQDGPAQLDLMPMPATLTMPSGAGALPVDSNFSVALSGAGARDSRVQASVIQFFHDLTAYSGIPVHYQGTEIASPSGKPTLRIVVESADGRGPQKLGDDESYSLRVTPTEARLSASRPLGAIRGLQTFLQLVRQNTSSAANGGTTTVGYSAPAVSIQDGPRFPWRGLSLDVSRHFIPVGGVERTLNGMASVKLNVLHWHLSDDQGFRVQSKRYPRLQQFGSDGMFYTQTEIREVVAYARDRGIRVVPEFDMPGHTTSFLPGYPKLGAGSGQYSLTRGAGVLSDLFDPTKDSTYAFLDGFIGEMVKLFPDEYFHIGGDEVDPKQWNANPAIRRFMQRHKLADAKQLQTYFNQRLLKIVTRHGKHMEGWDEILQPNLPKSILVQSWRGQPSLWEGARQGYAGILSAGYYLDLMFPSSYHYEVDPLKTPPPAPNHRKNAPPAQDVGKPADLTPEQAKLILGGEAAMWMELATAENVDAKLWPRLAPIAERFWSPESVTDVASMYRRSAVMSNRLEALGLTPRTSLERMRHRLAQPSPVGPLDAFVSVLEPVKGYSRHAERYNIFTPFNRLVDSIPPESNSGREFREHVETYLAGSKGPEQSALIRSELNGLLQAIEEVRPMLQKNSVLNEALPVADAMRTLCTAGNAAIDKLDGSGNANPAQADMAQALQNASQPRSDMLIIIAPAIQKLVAAASGNSVAAIPDPTASN